MRWTPAAHSALHVTDVTNHQSHVRAKWMHDKWAELHRPNTHPQPAPPSVAQPLVTIATAAEEGRRQRGGGWGRAGEGSTGQGRGVRVIRGGWLRFKRSEEQAEAQFSGGARQGRVG